jgi:hypothetical protein
VFCNLKAVPTIICIQPADEYCWRILRFCEGVRLPVSQRGEQHEIANPKDRLRDARARRDPPYNAVERQKPTRRISGRPLHAHRPVCTFRLHRRSEVRRYPVRRALANRRLSVIVRDDLRQEAHVYPSRRTRRGRNAIRTHVYIMRVCKCVNKSRVRARFGGPFVNSVYTSSSPARQ